MSCFLVFLVAEQLRFSLHSKSIVLLCASESDHLLVAQENLHSWLHQIPLAKEISNTVKANANQTRMKEKSTLKVKTQHILHLKRMTHFEFNSRNLLIMSSCLNRKHKV